MQKQSRKDENSLSDYVFGKLPPQAVDLEEIVLARALSSRGDFEVVSNILSKDSFYNAFHSAMFQAMQSLFDTGKPIDISTVWHEMVRLNISEGSHPADVVGISMKIQYSGNLEHHAFVIQEKAMRRNLIESSSANIRMAYDESIDTFEVIDSAEKSTFEISREGAPRSIKQISGLVFDVMRASEEAKKRKDGLSGVPSGFSALDRITSGFQNGNFIVIGARPGMGKTSLVLEMARCAASEYDIPVAFFSLEMQDTEIVQRLLSIETGIPSDKIRNGKMEEAQWQQFGASAERVSNYPLYIDDKPSAKLSDIRSKARLLKSKKGIKIIFIDYIQLMVGQTNGRDNREQEISKISRGLKELAKELSIPIVALAQLSRAVETRGGSKRPLLSDIRESGSLEQDADIVGFIYRAEYYGIKEDESGNSTEGKAEFIVAKNRSGMTGTIDINFEGSCTRFSDIIEKFEYKSPSQEVEGFKQTSIISPTPKNDDEDIPF